ALRPAWRCVLLISTGASSAGIAIDAIEGLYFVGLAIVGLSLLIVALGVRMGALHKGDRGCGRKCRAGAQRAKEITPPDCRFAFSLHCGRLLSAHCGSANACVSISTNTRPSVPT